MSFHIIVYANCSRGGVSTVIRNRALAEPDSEFLAIFFKDTGGLGTFADIENLKTVICMPETGLAYIEYATSNFEVSSINVIALPDIAIKLAEKHHDILEYEFHTSYIATIARELSIIQSSRLTKLSVPSKEMRDVLLEQDLLPNGWEVSIRKNQLAHSVFDPNGTPAVLKGLLDPLDIPLVWMGRVGATKGEYDFLACLRLLPQNYQGIMLLSMSQTKPEMQELANEAFVLGISERVHFLFDLPQNDVAQILRYARLHKGALISTSYSESFGYAVYESAQVGLSAIGYSPENSLWDELPNAVTYVPTPVGDVRKLSSAIQEHTQGLH